LKDKAPVVEILTDRGRSCAVFCYYGSLVLTESVRNQV